MESNKKAQTAPKSEANASIQLDPGAVHGPGGDSRPDLIEPETAEFRRADDDPALNTIREDLAPMPHAELHETIGRTEEELEKHVEKGGG